MYTSKDFKTKKAFREHVESGKDVGFYQPGLGPEPPRDGQISVEGPHYPKPHTWYASVELSAGKVVRIDGKKIAVKTEA